MNCFQDGGIMNRVIDVAFNSIKDQQTRKFRIVPDRLNGFEIRSDAEAAQNRQQEMIHNMKAGRNRKVMWFHLLIHCLVTAIFFGPKRDWVHLEWPKS